MIKTTRRTTNTITNTTVNPTIDGETELPPRPSDRELSPPTFAAKTTCSPSTSTENVYVPASVPSGTVALIRTVSLCPAPTATTDGADTIKSELETVLKEKIFVRSAWFTMSYSNSAVSPADTSRVFVAANATEAPPSLTLTSRVTCSSVSPSSLYTVTTISYTPAGASPGICKYTTLFTESSSSSYSM